MKMFSWLQNPKVDNPDEAQDPSLSPGLQARLTELEKMPVTEAMIPRAVVKALDADVQLRRVRRLKSAKTLYFPVYKGDLDHILGWISKQKVLELMNEPTEEMSLTQHLRPVGEINDAASVADLADTFLKSESPFIVVKNAQGGTAGVVPLSEFIELLFGFELVPAENLPPADLASPPLRNYEI
jgi:CBS domain containing-hemolysin-like protein